MAAEDSNRPARPISACISTNKRFFLSASGDVRPWAIVADLADAHVVRIGGAP
jgi:hypothetical protein